MAESGYFERFKSRLKELHTVQIMSRVARWCPVASGSPRCGLHQLRGFPVLY